MRTETITKTYLTFDELNQDQKSKVLDNLRDINTDYEWYDTDKEDFHTILGLLGFENISSEFTGFYSQGDGASFKADFIIPKNQKELKERMNKLLEYAPLYFKGNNDIKKLYLTLNFKEERKEEMEEIEIYKMGRYSHECTMYCDNQQLQEFARFMAGNYYNGLYNQYEYLISDEAVEECILCNNYEFDIDTLEIT